MKNTALNQDWELLSAYVDGQLQPDQKAKVEQRLSEDAALRAILDQLVRTRAVLRAAPRRRVPRNFTLTPAMVKQKSQDQSWANFWPRLFPVFGAASALASILFILFLTLQLLPPSTSLVSNPAAMLQIESAGTANDTIPTAPIIYWGNPQQNKDTANFASGAGGMGGGGGGDGYAGESTYQNFPPIPGNGPSTNNPIDTAGTATQEQNPATSTEMVDMPPADTDTPTPESATEITSSPTQENRVAATSTPTIIPTRLPTDTPATQPTASPTPTPGTISTSQEIIETTLEPTPDVTTTPTESVMTVMEITATQTPTFTSEPELTATQTSSPTPTATPSPTMTVIPSTTPTLTETPTEEPSSSPWPTSTPFPKSVDTGSTEVAQLPTSYATLMLDTASPILGIQQGNTPEAYATIETYQEPRQPQWRWPFIIILGILALASGWTAWKLWRQTRL